MKICIINNLYKPYNKGGAETVIENIIYGLSLDNEIILITLGRKDSVRTGLRPVRTYYTKPCNIFSYLDIDSKKNILLKLIWWLINIFNISSYIKIKKILKQEEQDVVNLHNLTGIGFLVFRLAKKAILTLHDIQLVYPSGRLIYGQENKFINNNFLIYLYKKISRFLEGSPDIVISPSKWLLDFYNKNNFFKKSKKYILKNPLNINDKIINNNFKNNLEFLYVGQIEEYKGIFLLLKIFNKLRNYKLNIVGSGKDLEKAKKFVENNNLNNIIFHGKLDKEELNKIYLQSNILIFPSLTYENCPSVILEAQSFGLLVIASRIGGVPELVDEKYLFEPGNEKELESLIDKVINNNHIKSRKITLQSRDHMASYINKFIEICNSYK